MDLRLSALKGGSISRGAPLRNLNSRCIVVNRLYTKRASPVSCEDPRPTFSDHSSYPPTHSYLP